MTSASNRPLHPTAFGAGWATALKGIMRLSFFIVMLLAPALASAEVLDKEFSLTTVAGVALFGCVAAFWTARTYPWALAILLPVTGIFFWLHLSELLDPFVGPAMAAEGGIAYVITSWLAPVAVAVSTAFGVVLRGRGAKAAF